VIKNAYLQQDGKIAVLCGNGDLPLSIMEALDKQEKPYIAIGFEGMTETGHFQDQKKDIHIFPLGHIGHILEHFKKNNVSHVVMVGGMRRPSLSSLSFDALGKQWLTKLGMSAFFGDGALFEKIMNLLEEEGLHILSPKDILPELMSRKGALTLAHPCAQARLDYERGKAILNALAPFDVGQSIVVQQGLILGIEAIEGTAELLKRVSAYKREGFGGVLVKCAKKGQSLAVDMPTIGLQTAIQVKEAGLLGIFISAHTTQILNQEKIINYMNEHGLFLESVEGSE
jgi:hypothetical protein